MTSEKIFTTSALTPFATRSVNTDEMLISSRNGFYSSDQSPKSGSGVEISAKFLNVSSDSSELDMHVTHLGSSSDFIGGSIATRLTINTPSYNTDRAPNSIITSVSRTEQTSARSATIPRIAHRDLLEKCRKRFVQVAKNEEVEYGFIAPSEVLLNEYFERYNHSFGDIAQHIYLKEIENKNVLIALLKALSTRNYQSVYPYAQTVAIAALSNKNNEVREAGIRAFENWGHIEGLDVLKSVLVGPEWLEEYRLDTIEYLESYA